MQLALKLLLCLAVSLVSAQNYPYKQTIATLCSPAFAGRGYVNEGSQKAAQFIATEFQKIGLQPLQKNYFQDFKFPVQTFPGVCDFIIGADTLKPGIDYLVDPGSASISQAQTYDLVYCNVATLYRSVNAFKPCPTNRMLVVQTSGFGGDTNKVMRVRLQELQKFAAVLELTTQKLTWSVSQTALPYPAFSAVANKFANRPAQARLQLETKYFTAYPAQNVLGYFPAAQKAKKKPYIVVSAHYDHLGQMGQNTYFPGANDNASGVGMLLYMAQELSLKRDPNFNYVFIAFAGEEAGLLGSKYFVEHPLFALKQIRFLLNTDIMGSGEEGITVVNATLFKPEFERLQELNTEGSYLTQVKSRGPAANSDHYFFTESGVPAFFVYTMGPNKHYHDIEDKSEELSFAAFEPLSQLLLRFLRSF